MLIESVKLTQEEISEAVLDYLQKKGYDCFKDFDVRVKECFNVQWLGETRQHFPDGNFEVRLKAKE